MLGYPASVIRRLKISLPEPSDVFIKRKLEIDEAKARVVQAVVGTGLFPTDHIYKEYYDMTDTEIEMLKKDLEKEQEKQNAQEMEQQAGQAQTQAAADMAVANNQADNDMAMQQMQQQAQPAPKKEEIDSLTLLKQQYLMNEGVDSVKYRAIDRVLKNKNKIDR